MANANNLFNNYTITPRSLTEYTAFRGVTDFTNIGQFDQYESGYQFLEVISMPYWIQKDPSIKVYAESFKHMLEFEFRGLEGLPDLNSDAFTITDGINELRMINKVTMDTSVEISMQYFEKRGSLITKFSEYYLTGLKDPKTQAKTYHGLIADGTVAPGLENEVFTMLYYVTDNTMLRLERAVLLCNCQLTKAELSMYNGSRDNISNKEMTISFNCFPVYGKEVDKAANYLLQNITGVSVTNSNGVVKYNGPKSVAGAQNTVLDSSSYRYGIMDKGQPDTDILDPEAKLSKAIS